MKRDGALGRFRKKKKNLPSFFFVRNSSHNMALPTNQGVRTISDFFFLFNVQNKKKKGTHTQKKTYSRKKCESIHTQLVGQLGSTHFFFSSLPSSRAVTLQKKNRISFSLSSFSFLFSSRPAAAPTFSRRGFFPLSLSLFPPFFWFSPHSKLSGACWALFCFLSGRRRRSNTWNNDIQAHQQQQKTTSSWLLL